ncbi:MAG: hypothetical protein IKJ60_01820 [Ruminococcus sp.]|nr:hypothetical protein [Ruminococcus sp.]
MKFKHTIDLIYFLRETYDLYEHTDYSPILARKIAGYPGFLGTGIPRKICDTVTDEKHDIIANLSCRGYSRYVSAGSITGLPLSYDEEKEYLKIMSLIVESVKNEIDDKELCDSMIEYVKSTKFYIEKYGNDL